MEETDLTTKAITMSSDVEDFLESQQLYKELSEIAIIAYTR